MSTSSTQRYRHGVLTTSVHSASDIDDEDSDDDVFMFRGRTEYRVSTGDKKKKKDEKDKKDKKDKSPEKDKSKKDKKKDK